VKLESPEGIAHCEEIVAVPGLAFAEIGPGDLSLSLGYLTIPSEPYPAEMQAARDRVLLACRNNGVAFLQGCTADNVIARIEEGVRVIAGHSEAAAIKGRAHQQRTLPV
jgi:citrate lyase beta subunit